MSDPQPARSRVSLRAEPALRVVASAFGATLLGAGVEGAMTLMAGGPWVVLPIGLGFWVCLAPLFAAAGAALWLAWSAPPVKALRGGLADPARRPAWLAGAMTAGSGAAAALILLGDALDAIRPRLNDVTLLVPIAAVVAALALAAALAAGLLVGPLLRRALTRRRPGLRTTWLLALIAGALPALAVWPAASYLSRDMVLRPMWMLIGGVVVTVALIASARRLPAWTLFLAPVLVIAGVMAHGRSPAARAALYAHGGLTSAVVSLVQARTDADGDGSSPYLSGGDCDDTNPSVHPAAVDIPGNRLDEDCDGADAVAIDEQVRPLTARAELPPHLIGRWNLLLITVDTLRADRMSVYGHTRDTTPNLTRLAERAWVVDRAYTPSNSTRYALPSLFSGRLLADMDVEHLTPYVYVRPGNALLFERMAAAGWTVEAHLPEQLAGSMWFGLDAGVQSYIGHADATLRGRSIMALNRAAKQTLPRLAGGTGPWALWLHYLEPHEPYVSQGTISFGRKPIDRYDAEIAATDRAIGEVLMMLDELDETDRTMVVITSDHGEEFGEHGRQYHGHQLFEESVRIPLMIAVPGGGARRIATPGVLQDITPTVAHLLDLPAAPDYGARSLAGYGAGVTPDDPERPIHLTAFVTARWPRLRSSALIRGPLKAMNTRKATQVFDLVADPGEKEALEGASGEALLDALATEDARQRVATRRALARHHMAESPPPDLDRRRAGPVVRGVQLLGTTMSYLDVSVARYPRLDVWFAVQGEEPADATFEVTVHQNGARLRSFKGRPLAGLAPTGTWPADRVGRMSFVIRDGGAVTLELSVKARGQETYGPVEVAEVEEGVWASP